MREPRILSGYCVASTFALEPHKFVNGGSGDRPDLGSKKVHAINVSGGSLATSRFRDDAIRSAGGEQLLGSRLQVEVDQGGAWKDWLVRAANRPELTKETCERCLEATTGVMWEDVRDAP